MGAKCPPVGHIFTDRLRCSYSVDTALVCLWCVKAWPTDCYWYDCVLVTFFWGGAAQYSVACNLEEVEQVVTFFFLSYDKSAESIFSNNIGTRKNMGNVQFIDQVGQCFSVMHSIEEYWNKWTTNVNEATTDIADHPGNYEGDTWAVKCLRCEKTRHYIQYIHTMKGWFSYTAATMRYHNWRNMKAIGIEELEVTDYADAREMNEEIDEAAPNPQI